MSKRRVIIPQVHDHELIKHGCKHPEGSTKILKENLLAAIDAAIDNDIMGDNGIIVCYRNKDEEGWNFGIGVTSLNDLSEVVINLDTAKKLVIQ